MTDRECLVLARDCINDAIVDEKLTKEELLLHLHGIKVMVDRYLSPASPPLLRDDKILTGE